MSNPLTMQCDICSRTPSGRLPFHCTICARNALYEPRIQLAQSLLNKESLGKKVAQAVGQAPPTEGPGAKPTWVIHGQTADRLVSQERTDQILDHVAALRTGIGALKDDIARRKAALAEKRKNLGAAKRNLSQKRTETLAALDKDTRRTQQLWDISHRRTAESRYLLCQEVTDLLGLHQRKRRKGSSTRDSYTIGGVPLYDLRDLNNASPMQVSASIATLAHLTYLISHYLGLRLPAEITLPHREYPIPTIFSPGSSYSNRNVPFPGSTPSHSSANSPSASRISDSRPLPRPRLLYLDRKLSVLAKDDPLAYSHLIEGITLLAWDIAWICKTQGLDVGGKSLDEVCAMAKNLWQLLFSSPAAPRPSLSRAATATSTRSKSDQQRSADDNPPALKEDPPPPALGYYSHGTAHSYLASAEGSQYLRTWRLSSPHRVIDKVKAMLLSERTGAEWELLEENEWGEEKAPPESVVAADPEQEAVLVKARRRIESGNETTKDGPAEDSAAAKGVSGQEREGKGWMKVKSRGGS